MEPVSLDEHFPHTVDFSRPVGRTVMLSSAMRSTASYAVLFRLSSPCSVNKKVHRLVAFEKRYGLLKMHSRKALCGPDPV